MKILLTGKPASGKTTLLEQFVAAVPNRHGFLTREVREGGVRVRFELVSSSGQIETLARADSDSEIRVGRFGVDIDQLDRFLDGMPAPEQDALLYIDEIGQAQLLSEKFKTVAQAYLDADNLFVGTISSIYENEFILSVLQRMDIVLLTVSEGTRVSIDAALEGLAENVGNLERLDARAQEELIKLAQVYARENNFTLLRKLFKNAIKYVAESRVKLVKHGCYEVRGNNDVHIVDHAGQELVCDCVLFNGKDQFKGQFGDCSHVQAVRITT